VDILVNNLPKLRTIGNPHIDTQTPKLIFTRQAAHKFNLIRIKRSYPRRNEEMKKEMQSNWESRQ